MMKLNKHGNQLGTGYTMDAFIDAISRARFGRYYEWANGNTKEAMELYAANMQMSEALHTSLHMLEITLRNKIDAALTDFYGPAWYDYPIFQQIKSQRQICLNAYRKITRMRREPIPERIIPELSFGFWVALFGRHYEPVWQKTLKIIARREDGSGLLRKELAEPLDRIRTLRNRVYHYEPILHKNPGRTHRDIEVVLAWLCTDTARWCASHDRFAGVFAKYKHSIRVPKNRFRH